MAKKKVKKTRRYPRVQKVIEGTSRTKQAMKRECDINHIMKVYKNHGVLTHVNNRQANYGDFSNVPDYLEAQQLIINAQEQFSLLPSMIRERFDNDPAMLLAFLNNEENIEEAISLGILEDPNANIDELDLADLSDDLKVKNEKKPKKVKKKDSVEPNKSE